MRRISCGGIDKEVRGKSMKCPKCTRKLKELTGSAMTCMNCRISYLNSHLE